MYPLAKLARLPEGQRRRKLAKLFAAAEMRAASNNNTIDGDEFAYLQKAAPYIGDINDDEINLPGAEIQNAEIQNDDEAKLRWVNAVRHRLLALTGKLPADWDFIDHNGKLDAEKRRVFPGMFAYLEDIRSPFNIGALFRTAESFGAEKLFLSPHCADPLHPRAARTAMGCIDALPWERGNLQEIKMMMDAPVFAMESGGAPLRDFVFPERGILVAGSEELGVSPASLALADSSLGRVTIPSYGAKASLNVSAAFAIVMQAWSAARAL